MKGTMEYMGPMDAKEATTVKGPTERKLKFFSYSRMAVHIIYNYLFKFTIVNYGRIFKS